MVDADLAGVGVTDVGGWLEDGAAGSWWARLNPDGIGSWLSGGWLALASLMVGCLSAGAGTGSADSLLPGVVGVADG